jgi:hypothetical protein
MKDENEYRKIMIALTFMNTVFLCIHLGVHVYDFKRAKSRKLK